MRYTLLAVNAHGVALLAYHERRLGLEPGAPGRDAFARHAREAGPGVWAAWVDDEGGLRVERRPGTRLHDGMPARLLPSPLDRGAGLIPKPPPPGLYAPLRLDGTATLLTSSDGSEVYEACSAAVLGWDGARLVSPPLDRPRVWSTAEAALREHLDVREAPVPPRGMPLLLVNAVKGTCTLGGAERDQFPARARREIDDLLESLAGWPGSP